MQEQSEVCEHTVSEKDLLIKDWEDNWKLRAAFYGMRDAYEKEHMDLDDK